MEAINFFGLKVTSFTEVDLNNYIEKCLESNESYVYYGYSLAVLSYLNKYHEYYNVTSQFDLMITDGRIFYILIKLFGYNIKYDISIPRLTFKVLDIANKKNLKVFVLGGTKESNTLACKKIKGLYSNISEIRGKDGYFSSEELDSIIESIKLFKPKIIFIGMPTPQKQVLALKIKNRISGCIIIPFGGMVDVLADKEKLTPLFIKKIGLASIYRHIQNPKRLPELFIIGIRALYIFPYCAFHKFIFNNDKISIPEILKPKNII